MARLPRLAVGGQTHHVLQRGHNAQPVFIDDEDRETFVRLMRTAAAAERVALHGYVLLDNEVQLLVTPQAASGLSRLMQALARRHGARFNRRHGHVGTLWSGRFRASVVDPDGWVLRCLRFIETAAARGSGQPNAGTDWSSAAHHLGQRRDAAITEHAAYWSLGNTPFEREWLWDNLLQQALTSHENNRIVEAIHSGMPLGSDQFRAVLATYVVRPLALRQPGRPARRASQKPVPDKASKS